jgi:dTDP-4-amino-4,6-dideoxygalactose transaminase
VIARIRPEASVVDVMRSLAFQDGCGVGLEKGLTNYFGVKQALTFQSARAGLFYILSVLPHRKVYLPAYTCWVIPEAVTLAGKEIVYVDIRPGDLNLDVEQLRKVLEPNSIILATHQLGIPSDMDAIMALAREQSCVVIEDNAAAFGSEYRGKRTGSFGSAAILSFEYSKTLVAGRGGAALFNDGELFERVTALKAAQHRPARFSHGFKQLAMLSAYSLATVPLYYRAVHTLFSIAEGETTGRLMPFAQAPTELYLEDLDPARQKLAYLNLQKIKPVIDGKKRIAAFYHQRLSSLPGLKLPELRPDRAPVYVRFPIRVGNKSSFYQSCARAGLDLAFAYSYVCAEDAARFPVSRAAAESVLNLPIYSHLSDPSLERITAIVERALRA